MLNKAKIELVGDEILAAAEALAWSRNLPNRIDAAIKKQEEIDKLVKFEEKPELNGPIPLPQSLPDGAKKSPSKGHK